MQFALVDKAANVKIFKCAAVIVVTMVQFNCNKLLLWLVLLIDALSAVFGYKYLAVLPTMSKSHFIVGSALMKELARKGHEVTMISPFPLKTPMKNYVDIATPSIIKALEGPVSDFLATRERSNFKNILDFHAMGIMITQAILEEPGVKALMRSNQTFDAVICEVFLSEALYGLAEHFNAPLIGLGPFGAILWNTDMIGSPSPPSYVPSTMLPFTDHMTLPQRLGNMAFVIWVRIYTEFFYLPRQIALYDQYFPHAKRSLLEVRKNAALVLLNQHVSLSFPRPYMPNQIEVGGMHINRKRKPLPAEIQKFIDGAEHGVIYFSMGSNLKSKDLPIEKRKAILETLRNLKHRVLWKFEEPALEGKPDNVFISNWFPQDDILAHPNVRAFITHGGLLSTTESIYHGKPFIGIPIFADQFLNMVLAEMNGCGIMLDYNELTVAKLSATIKRITEEPAYTQLVKSMSERYRDQPMEPLALAVHWVEHVARHKGATYLHCAGLDLNFWQYHSIDVLAILFGIVLVVLLSLALLIRGMCRKVLGLFFKQKSGNQSVEKKQK